ncbi:hypothetical protein BP5796_11701 [Coleophoma crateriformis]|uniref:Lipid droplet-associated hydrolase n=1 Tax=Coleophoma crateriformis TaxID=565419 RepID=A0A3D8QE47_9HELO|nr:hypothetical protein BP5796_11701 [Coleophoma crateriformis]
MRSSISISPVSGRPDASYHLVFFITGNPGLIEYYDIFLSNLHTLLSSKDDGDKPSDVVHIWGQNLAGFSDDTTEAGSGRVLFSLEQQIEILLESVRSKRIPSGPRASQPYDGIILIGHSVGSYILLEIISRLRQSSQPTENIKGGILLFPTVTHIGKSPSGVKISTLFRIPDFPRIASTVAKALMWPLPRAFLKSLVGLVTRMPEEAAEVTTNFLTSRMGIYQALYLAKYEMAEITEDRWDDDIWGIEQPVSGLGSSTPKLVFYFGENDHWVASHTRDELIAARACRTDQGNSSKPIMLIDKDGIDHGFCIKNSETVAEKVTVWVDDILQASRGVQ